jgi:hypothetical protein
MDERTASAVADMLGGEIWNSGGSIWLVLFRRSDGKMVVLSDESVCVYSDETVLLGGGTPETSLLLR